MLADLKKSILVVANVQVELIPYLHAPQQLVDNCCWLLDLAKTLNLEHIIFEHTGLGKTIPRIHDFVADETLYFEKVHFDCTQSPQIMDKINGDDKDTVILSGTETHIGIMQSALQLNALGKNVYVVADAASTRHQIDHTYGLKRLINSGIKVVTREMLFFELIKYSKFPNYIDMSLKFLDNRYTRK